MQDVKMELRARVVGDSQEACDQGNRNTEKSLHSPSSVLRKYYVTGVDLGSARVRPAGASSPGGDRQT
jgi:hypothetical protein